jgi:hypothetical protein
LLLVRHAIRKLGLDVDLIADAGAALQMSSTVAYRTPRGKRASKKRGNQLLSRVTKYAEKAFYKKDLMD